MQNLNRITAVLLLCVFAAALSGCGKISTPAVIEGSGYPHTYPRS